MCPVIAADAAPATPAIPGSGILTQNVKFVRQSLGKFRPVRERIIFRGLGGFGIVIGNVLAHVLVMRVQRYRLPHCCS